MEMGLCCAPGLHSGASTGVTSMLWFFGGWKTSSQITASHNYARSKAAGTSMCLIYWVILISPKEQLSVAERRRALCSQGAVEGSTRPPEQELRPQGCSSAWM